MGCILLRSEGHAPSIAKPRYSVHSTPADVQPKTLLALSICKRPVRRRTKLFIPVPSLRKDIPHELSLQIGRRISDLQDLADRPPVSHVGILQAQGMARQACRSQQLAEPLSVP
jgi:hypothetical protein